MTWQIAGWIAVGFWSGVGSVFVFGWLIGDPVRDPPVVVRDEIRDEYRKGYQSGFARGAAAATLEAHKLLRGVGAYLEQFANEQSENAGHPTCEQAIAAAMQHVVRTDSPTRLP